MWDVTSWNALSNHSFWSTHLIILSKSCCSRIRELRRIRSYLNSKTATASTGVCKYYIGPIGDLSLLTATAGAAARVHSLHWVIKIKFQKWCCCVLLQQKQLFDTRTPPPPPTASVYQPTTTHKEWVHWRSIPSRRLWQLTKTGRRWGRCSIYRHPCLYCPL